jgi:hypothetical protein
MARFVVGSLALGLLLLAGCARERPAPNRKSKATTRPPQSQEAPAGKEPTGLGPGSIQVKECHVLKGHPRGARTLIFAPDGKALAVVCGTRKHIKLWDVASGKEKATLEAPADVTAVAFRADGKALYAGTVDGKLLLWETDTGKKLPSPAIKPSKWLLGARAKGMPWTDADLRGIYKVVAIAPGCTNVVISSDGLFMNPPMLYNVSTGDETPLEDGGRGSSAMFAPDGKTLVMWEGGEHSPTLFDVASGRKMGSLDVRPLRLMFSPDSRALAVLTERDILYSVQFWDVGKRQLLDSVQFPDTESGRICLAFFPDGQILVTRGRTLVFFEVASGKERAILRLTETNTTPVHCIAVSPDGQTLAVGQDTRVTLHDVRAIKKTDE